MMDWGDEAQNLNEEIRNRFEFEVLEFRASGIELFKTRSQKPLSIG